MLDQEPTLVTFPPELGRHHAARDDVVARRTTRPNDVLGFDVTDTH
jgi:hypothetical protein